MFALADNNPESHGQQVTNFSARLHNRGATHR